MSDVYNTDETIDSRDLLENIEELQDEINTLDDEQTEIYGQIAESETETTNLQTEFDDINDLDIEDETILDEKCLYLQDKIDNAEEELSVTLIRLGEVIGLLEAANETLSVLDEVANDARAYNCDFDSGATLIAEDYFETYAYELAVISGVISNEATWPYDHIDWAAAADALKADYASINYDGEEYWIRCT